MSSILHLHLKFCALIRARKWQSAYAVWDEIEIALLAEVPACK